MKAILLKCVIPALAAIASCNPAIAALYSIGPSSSVTLSGTVNLEITSSLSATKITGSGNIAEQGPGSLTSTLFGFINANASGTGLTFPGEARSSHCRPAPGLRRMRPRRSASFWLFHFPRLAWAIWAPFDFSVIFAISHSISPGTLH